MYRNGDCVIHPHFGPLCINGRFRDGGGVCLMAINGLDGVSYQFYPSEVKQRISREDFDAEMSLKKAASQAVKGGA